MRKRLAFLFLLLVYEGFSQIGGKNTFQFLNVPVDAHTAAIGGTTASNQSPSLYLTNQNPALLSDTMNQQVYLSYIPYFADIKATSVGYARKIKGQMWTANLSYFNYGEITETDETGQVLGSFKPNDFYLQVGTSQTIAPFTLGATAKIAYSKISSAYDAVGLYADLGGVFRHPKRDFTIGMAFRNLGMPVKTYTKGAKENMPLDIRLGTTYRLEHVPLRLSLTAQRLDKFDVVYLDTALAKTKDLEGNDIIPKKTFGDKVLRHFVIGTEVLLSKHLHIRFGYNFLRRKEMRLDTRAGVTGFSWGLSLRIKKLDFDFSRSYYHLSGGRNWITLVLRLQQFTKVKTNG